MFRVIETHLTQVKVSTVLTFESDPTHTLATRVACDTSVATLAAMRLLNPQFIL